MPRPANHRHFRLPASHGRTPSDVRTSDVVLAVVFVALLGMYCLLLIGSLVAPSGELAAVPPGALQS